MRSLVMPLLVVFGGCISAAGTVAKPTALELQLLGAYEELDKSLVHASSVRGPLNQTASFEMLKAQAIEQRALQRFNEDDILELKTRGCIAETLMATVIDRPCSAPEDPAKDRRLARVVREENRARRAILSWAAHALARQSGRAEPTQAEVDEIRSAYQRLLKEAAAPEHLLELKPGVYAPKSEATGVLK